MIRPAVLPAFMAAWRPEKSLMPSFRTTILYRKARTACRYELLGMVVTWDIGIRVWQRDRAASVAGNNLSAGSGFNLGNARPASMTSQAGKVVGNSN
jgi:hypothetical protein